MKKTLFTIALPEEKICLPESDDIKVVVTKVGKACSAYFLIKAMYEYKPDIVINIGTAGTFNMNVGDIVVSNRFYDRDLAPLTIEGVVSEINSCSNVSLPSLLSNKEVYDDFVVNTGDDFVTETADIVGHAIDMEAFAQAMVCNEEHVPFMAVKYITDKIGENSVKIWNDKLADARNALECYTNRYILPFIKL